MVSDKPPRRSKREKEPVTIDLTPEETGPVAEPVRAIDADEPLTSAEQGSYEVEKWDSDAPKAGDAAEPAAEEVTASSATQDDTASFSASDHQPLDETPAEPHAPQEPEPTTSSNWTSEREQAPEVQQRRSPSTSTMIASGIFGGIVALLLAGSMQYAGYIPGTSRSNLPDTSNLTAELDALRQEVAALKNRPAQAAAPDPKLADRVAALEANAGNQTPATDDQAVTALQDELAQLRSLVEANRGNATELQQRVNAAEAKLNDTGPEQQAARAVAAAALKAAIDRGGSFEAELQTYANVAGNDTAVADLGAFATGGVPSRNSLQTEFSNAADKMLEAAAQPDPNQGITGRLLSSAMSVVKVRRVGDVQGDTPDAAVARMEEAVRNGDLQAAAREWEELPEAAKAASQEYKKKLDARLQVENLVNGALSRAVAGTQG